MTELSWLIQEVAAAAVAVVVVQYIIHVIRHCDHNHRRRHHTFYCTCVKKLLAPPNYNFYLRQISRNTPKTSHRLTANNIVYYMCGHVYEYFWNNGRNSQSLSNGSLLTNLHVWNGLQGVGRAIYNLSHPNLILTCPRCIPVLQTRLCEPRHDATGVSSNLQEMPEYNQAVWRRKGSKPTIRLTFRQTSNLSRGKSE